MGDSVVLWRRIPNGMKAVGCGKQVEQTGKPLLDYGLGYGLSRIEVSVHILYFDRLPRLADAERVKYADMIGVFLSLLVAEHENVGNRHTSCI